MAQVIKQQTQVFNKPVGVIRTAGGAEQLGQSISRAAGALADREYSIAAKNAQAVGGKAGMAVASSDIAEIDPTTNMPVAYTAPATFGRIASGAYQDLIDKRFADSVKMELEAKGSEFAASSSNAAAYKTRMSNYVEAMYNAGGDQTAYTRMIAEGGAEYITSTYTSLRKKEIAAEKKAVLREAALSDYRLSQKLSFAVTSQAPAAEIQTLIADRILSNQNRLAAGGSVSSYIAADKSIKESYALFANNQLSSIYSDLSEEDQAKVILSLTDPSVLDSISKQTGVTQLRGLIADALVGTSVSSLRGGLGAITTAQASLDTIQVDEAKENASRVFEQNEVKLTAQTTAAQIQSMVSGIADEKLRAEVYGDLYFSMITKAGDTEIGSNVNVMDRVTAALKSDDPTAFDSLQGFVDPKFIENLKGMPKADKGDLAKALSDRRQELASIESFNDAQTEESKLARGQLQLDGLVDKFYTLDPTQKKELIAALQNPAAMKLFEKSSGISVSSEYVIASRALGEDAVRTQLKQVDADSMDNIKAQREKRKGAVNLLVEKNEKSVNKNTTDAQLRSMVISLDGKAAKDEAFHKLKLIQLEAAVSGSANSSDAIDKLTIALRNPSREALDDLSGVVDKGVISSLKDLSNDERKDLATGLETVRSAIQREESAAAANILETFKSRILSFSDEMVGGQLIRAHSALVSDIKKSDVVDKQTLINQADSKYSELAYDNFLDLGIRDTNSLDRIVRELRTGSVKNLTQSEQYALRILKPLHKTNSGNTESRLGKTIEEYKNLKLEEVNRSELDLITRQISVGERVSADDFKRLELDMFEGKPQTIASLLDNKIVVRALQNGVVFPALSKSMSRAMTGNNEANIRRTADLFERYANATATTEQGKPIVTDVMRQYLDENTYNILSAVSFVARDESMDSVEVLANFRAYGGIGAIDDEIKASLEIPKSGRVEDWLRQYDMSPEYRKEIATVMRIKQSRGLDINQGSLDAIIEDYTDQMVSDPFTVSTKIGGKVINSPSMHFTDRFLAQNSDGLAEALSNAVNNDYDSLLTKGTYGEARLQVLDPRTYLTAIGSKVDVGLSGYVLSIQSAQNARTISGKRAINVPLHYKPLGNSFDTGRPVFQVGYMGTNGFEVFAPDGVPWTVTQPNEAFESAFRLQSINNVKASINSNAPQSEIDTNNVIYLSSIYEFKIDDMMLDPEINRIVESESIGTQEDLLKIVNNAKKQFEAMK